MRKQDLQKLAQIKERLNQPAAQPAKNSDTNGADKNGETAENFASSLQGVKPIAQDKVQIQSTKVATNSEYRKQAASRKKIQNENFLTEFEVEPVAPEEVLSFKSPGLQPGVFRKLRLGEYGFDFKLDLHRKTVAEARQEVWNLLKYAESNGFRTLLITHGKGAMSNPPARIKSYVKHWLSQVDTVIAYHSAIPRHGGAGATWVLLKKPAAPNRINEVKYQ